MIAGGKKMIFENWPKTSNRSWEILFQKGNEKYRSWLQKVWEEYEPYAPPSFKNDIENDEGKLDSLTWEMLLANMLLGARFDLQKATSTDQPDLCVLYEGKKIWIECSVPQKGDSSQPDSVPPIMADGQVHHVDMNKNTLRVTNAILSKKEQHERWLSKNVCSAGEPFIIALHGKELNFGLSDGCLPDILRALYCVGDMVYKFDPDDAGSGVSSYSFQPAVKKSNDKQISTGCFLQDEFNSITGILFSKDWGPFYGSTQPKSCYVKNITTTNSSEISFEAFAQEYEYTDEAISLKSA